MPSTLPLLPDFVSLADLLLRFGRVERHLFHPDGRRPETDTDHTVMLAVIATSLAARFGLDPGLVAQFATLHDLVEVYDGDTFTFGISDQDRDEKEVRERAALARLRQETAAFPWIVATIERYEAQRDPEARFVRYLDKVLPRLTQILNEGAMFHAKGLKRADVAIFQALQGEKLAALYPEFPEIAVLFTEACRVVDQLAPE